MRTADLDQSINTDTNDKQSRIIGQNWFSQHLFISASKIIQANKIENNKHLTCVALELTNISFVFEQKIKTFVFYATQNLKLKT